MILENSAIAEVFINNSELIEKIKINKEYEKLLGAADKLERQIKAFLTEDQIKVLDEFVQVNLGLEASSADRFFAEGVKLGIRLAAECFFC